MRQHTIICRLGAQDTVPVQPARPGTHITEISFIDGARRLGFGLGQAIDQLNQFGLKPTERAIDLALLAAVLTAADTRVSRATESQDQWTREIDLHIPVAEPALWTTQADLIVRTVNFLTGDRWRVYFRPRIASLRTLAPQPKQLRTATVSCICLLSGGLDSFIGAIDLLFNKQTPMLVSHYWDGITSQHQTYCVDALRRQFPAAQLPHLRARVGFPTDMVAGSTVENTLRARSFLFFSLAALAGSTVGKSMVVHVPENGFISLNVPLDPLRVGALSTRTTHPFYMARFNELLAALGFAIRLENTYRHQTKGQMVRGCADRDFLRRQVKNTMSCSSPAKTRWQSGKPKHCGHCVPCLIRRAAIAAGLGDDLTEYSIPNLGAQVLNSKKADGEHIRSFQLALARLAATPQRARFDIHLPGPLTDYPTDLTAYEAVYAGGLREVGQLLNGVRAEPQ